MKKKIAVLLTIFMVLGCMPAMASAGHITPRIPLSGTGTTVDYYNGNRAGGDAIKLETSLAQRFIVKGKLVKLYMNCPSYSNAIGSMTFRLYQWNGDYAKTVRGKMLAEQTFVDFADNATLSMGIPGTVTGELLLVVCNPVEAVGVWTNTSTNPNSANEVLYIDGKAQPGRAMNLSVEVGTIITADQ